MPQPVASLNCNGLNPSVVSTTSTSTVYFPYLPGSAIGVTSGGGANAISSTGFVAGFLPIPGAGRANGQLLTVRACGNFQVGIADASCPTVQVGLYYTLSTMISATTASIKSLAVPAAVSTSNVGADPIPWRLVVNLNCDGLGTSGSGIMQGDYIKQLDGAALVAGTSTLVSGLNMASDQPMNLCIGVTFSVAGTTALPNIANMFQCVLEM